MLTIARRAESAGLYSLYCVEAWRSAFVPLTAVATATERVRIGPYILNAYGTTPFIAGMSAIDLDEISGGRLVMCVGSGNRHINEEYNGTPYARPLRKMAEYVELLRRSPGQRLGESVDYDGEVHRMHWSPAVEPTRSSIPVNLAAIYPKMVKVAGRVADGLALGALLSAGYVREVIAPAARSAAAEAGREPGDLRFLMAGFTSVDDDREHARDSARRAICSLYQPLPHPYYDFLLREQGFSSAADAATKLIPEGRLEAAVEAMDDDLVDSLCIAGTPAECRTRSAEYEGIIDEMIYSNVAAVSSTLSHAGEVSGTVESYERIVALA